MPAVNVRPPPFEPNVVITKTFRFASSGTATVSPNNFDLCRLLSVGYDGTHITGLFKSIRVHRITVWTASNGSATSTASVSFYNSADNVAGKEYSDCSLAGTNPAYVSVRPPQGSTAWFWQSVSTSVTMFTLNFSDDAIVDIHMSGVLRDGAQITNLNSTVSSAVLGTIYGMGLDGTATLAPVGYTTTS